MRQNLRHGKSRRIVVRFPLERLFGRTLLNTLGAIILFAALVVMVGGPLQSVVAGKGTLPYITGIGVATTPISVLVVSIIFVLFLLVIPLRHPRRRKGDRSQ